MDPTVVAATSSDADRPFLTRPELFALGHDDRDIRRALRSGAWTRVRVGVYLPTSSWTDLDERQRHVVAARACLERFGDRVALSHATALAVRGIVPDGASIGEVHLIRLDGGAGRRESGVVHHQAPPGSLPDVELVAGMTAVPAAYAARQVATRLDNKRTLGMLDALLHAGLVDQPALDRVEPVAERWPGAARFRLVRPLANACVESYGESYVRWICHAFKLPMPRLQREFFDERGIVWARTDFDWLDGHHLGEFDGRVKYVRLLKPGQTVSQVVELEKAREDRLRAVGDGAGMTRFVWTDVLDRNERTTADRIRADLERSTRLYVRR